MSTQFTVDECLPSSRERVIFFWQRLDDELMTSIGFYASNDDYLPDGWYEETVIDINGIDGVTHWQSLPVHPLRLTWLMRSN